MCIILVIFVHLEDKLENTAVTMAMAIKVITWHEVWGELLVAGYLKLV